MTGRPDLYVRGTMRPASEAEVVGLEPVAAWSLEHLVPRLMTGENPLAR